MSEFGGRTNQPTNDLQKSLFVTLAGVCSNKHVFIAAVWFYRATSVTICFSLARSDARVSDQLLGDAGVVLADEAKRDSQEAQQQPPPKSPNETSGKW